MKVFIYVNDIDIERLSYGVIGKMVWGFFFKFDEIRLLWLVIVIVLL